jgi:hypothetical protein
MSWYAAHLVLYVKYKEHPQTTYPLWENVVLIEAGTEEEAMAKAERRGHDDEGDDSGSFRWDDKPAAWVFAGVRQLIRCVDPKERPGDGTEVSYSEMEVDSLDTLKRFIQGQSVAVRFLESGADDQAASPVSHEEWEAALRAWAADHPASPRPADDDRDSTYAGRGE